jgi:hypothetical protein
MTENQLLPLSIQEGLQKYYFNRSHQKEHGWNKSADLDMIDKICTHEGWGYQATAGTFWFSKKLSNGNKVVIKISEDTFANGGESNLLATGEPYGAFAEITDALEKVGRKPLFINGNKE